MSVTITAEPKTQAMKDRILSLLVNLPLENLVVVEQFVRFLNEQLREGKSVTTLSTQERRRPYLYPTVPLPATVLDSLVGIMPPVGGDALADTEALYDKV